MRESTYINNAIQRGYERGQLLARRKSLLRLIQIRIQDPVPEPIRQVVENTTDWDLLDKWFEAAIKATTLADVLAIMNLQP
jgi:hypothetical protein